MFYLLTLTLGASSTNAFVGFRPASKIVTLRRDAGGNLLTTNIRPAPANMPEMMGKAAQAEPSTRRTAKIIGGKF